MPELMGLHIDKEEVQEYGGASVNHRATTRQPSAAAPAPIGNRRTVSIPARLTWRDAIGTLRFASVVIREIGDLEVSVECQVPAAIALYRLVHVQVEGPSRDPDLPETLRAGKVPSAVYNVGPRSTSTGTPMRYTLRLLVEPKLNAHACAHPVEQRLAVAI